jgi:hypothetical protein
MVPVMQVMKYVLRCFKGSTPKTVRTRNLIKYFTLKLYT